MAHSSSTISSMYSELWGRIIQIFYFEPQLCSNCLDARTRELSSVVQVFGMFWGVPWPPKGLTELVKNKRLPNKNNKVLLTLLC